MPLACIWGPNRNPSYHGSGARRAWQLSARRVIRRMFAIDLHAVMTEVNPSYDPSGVSVARYVDTVTGALIAGLRQAADH